VFGIGSNLFFGKETRQHLNLWVCGGCVVFRECVFFSFCLIVVSFTVSALEDVSLSGPITLLTQEAI